MLRGHDDPGLEIEGIEKVQENGSGDHRMTKNSWNEMVRSLNDQEDTKFYEPSLSQCF